MNSKRRHEGYLLIDHRYSPGITERGTPLGPGAVLEVSTYTCSHCQRIIMINPLRTRDREYCPKCDHYVCDECELVRQQSGGECLTFNQIIEEFQNKVVRQKE